MIEEAVRNASIEGLEGLTIGRLADRVAMSKSGLFGLFGSKQDLQLATLEHAVDLFVATVWEPARAHPSGLPRLLDMRERWLAYLRSNTLPGGCFMTTAAVEFDARPGPVRDAVALYWQRWLRILEREARAAVAAGQLPAGADPSDVAFQLNAIASAASTSYRLTGAAGVFEQARRTMGRLLDQRE